MAESVNIILRELKIKDLDDYFYWNLPSREFHKFNGPYYEKSNEEELKKQIEDLKIPLLKRGKKCSQKQKDNSE